MPWMPSPIELILAGLAAWRLAHAITQEDGPFDIFLNWRNWLLLHLPDRARDEVHWITRGFHCVLCVSFWTSLAAVLLLCLPGWIPRLVLVWLGVAGGVLGLHLLTRKEDG